MLQKTGAERASRWRVAKSSTKFWRFPPGAKRVRSCLDRRTEHLALTSREALNAYLQRVRGTLGGYSVRVLIDHSRFLILEGQGPVEGVTVYEFPSKDAARSWYDSVAYQQVRQHRKMGAKYLVILTEGGMLPAEQRMPHTKVTG
jgi:uncharacterized protein (DUF1330 family)